MLRSTEVYVVEYHAGGGGTSRKRLCDYAPHFYRLETEDGKEVYLTTVASDATLNRQARLLDIALSLLSDDDLMTAHDINVLGSNTERASDLQALIEYKGGRRGICDTHET